MVLWLAGEPFMRLGLWLLCFRSTATASRNAILRIKLSSRNVLWTNIWPVTSCWVTSLFWLVSRKKIIKAYDQAIARYGKPFKSDWMGRVASEK